MSQPTGNGHNRKVVAALCDLMFTVKIQEAAKRAGLDPVFVKSKQAALEAARLQPAVLILDLNEKAIEPLDLISDLKAADDTRPVRLVGFVSHVQADLIKAAQQKGCDTVLARSAFSQNLESILRRYAEPAA